jgi:hypothetical protein
MAEVMAEANEEEVEEIEIMEDGNEPIYYSPKALNLVSGIASWGSWVILAGFVLAAAGQLQYLNGIASQSSMTLIAFLMDKDQGAQVRSFVFTNALLPLLTGIGLLILLQAASIGLNALLEIDYNMRESKD